MTDPVPPVSVPTGPVPLDADGLRHDLAAVAAVLEEARLQADTGAPVDLAGLDARVHALCEAALSLPGAAARGLLQPLEALTVALDSLGEALTRQRDTLAAAAEARPDPHTVRRRAAAAYGRPAFGPVAEPPADPDADPSGEPS